ncbi:hypothetical protein K7X08_026329 [Anisodus acutangulus]|uniref:DUF6821 domain-containing protein n=1 Tax=Anisodus acutangulus TaxID=402998 RepID=A0A9Q1LLG3_9SOLA|nr:hypothetical protein K7X08_026329 [Anisodus acutangulus]
MNNSGEFWSDSDSERSKFSEYDGKNEGIRRENWSDSVRFSAGENSDGSVEEKQEDEKKIEGEQKRMRILWWKVPIELVKYCAFKGVIHVWAFSVAAAVMSFVILGRRLYNMKKKTKPLELKVTLDDKKVSQFMSRVARLNEAFSIMKRVPMIRPQLPAAGATLWPVMSLR